MSTSLAEFDGSRRLSSGVGEDSPPYGKPRRLDLLRQALRARHSSCRTEKTYVFWVRRFIFFNGVRHRAGMAEAEINSFLTHLALKEKVSAATQNQALSALLFLYRHVIGSVLEHNITELRGKRDLYDQLCKDLYSRGLVNTDDLHVTMTGHGLGQKRTTGIEDALLKFIEEEK